MLDIVVLHEHGGMTSDEIVTHLPGLSLADVHAALAYYFDHIQEIQEDMRAERELAEAARQGHASLLEGKLQQEGLQEAS